MSFAALAGAIRRSLPALIVAQALACAASAQTPPGVYKPGDAAVTGFSGALRPFEIEPGQDPSRKTFIDPDGPSLRVVDLRRMGGPPAAQLVGAPKPFTASAKLIGQVFGVALDDRSPANIYVAASSAYGLPIIAPGPDGQPVRVQVGTPGASFMPAQWGPGGGPGSIWKIDGVSGAVGLFATIATAGKANAAAALGGLAYDADTKSLFVADRESGQIHRLSLDGADRDSYDHGIAGRAAIGLAPAPAAAEPGVDITSPQFDSARPETWGYAPPERRVFGLAVRERRLYYAVADGLQIWSVGLNADGSFGADARVELAAPPAAGPTEISKIAFDDEGRMYLAERPAPTGAQDLEALAVPAIGRLLRYARIGATETRQPIWQLEPDEYAVGFPAEFRNDNGGVAIGYGYDLRGEMNPASCGGFVWTTGERLRQATDPKRAPLGQPEASAINGLQGTAVWRIRRDGAPPWSSYFIDYADAPPDALKRGHLGDVAILRGCKPQAVEIMPEPPRDVAGPLRPGRWTCRTHVCGPGDQACPPNQVWSLGGKGCVSGCAAPEILINGKCCDKKDLRPGGACAGHSTEIGKPSCGVGQTAIGPNHQCCDNSHVYSGANGEQQCCAGALVNGKCDSDKTTIPLCPACCAPNYVKAGGKCCLKSQMTAKGQCCPAGQMPAPGGTGCQPLNWLPKLSLCCASGFVPTGKGKCCAAANLTTSGECCPTALDPNDRKQCPSKSSPPETCGPGQARNSKGVCESAGRSSTTVVPVIPIRPKKCRASERRDASGACVPRTVRVTPDAPPVINRPIACPPGFVPGPLGQRCLPVGRGRVGPPAFGGPRIMRPPGNFQGRRW